LSLSLQGLRVLKTVIDIKGAKRFKKNNGANSIAASQLGDTLNSSNGFDAVKAKEDFRRMTQKTSYRT
jgi:hypothetical protein|tara:strand:- start:781 stop:984 length:204 start_codon:yes stop_codon:yes gene_type:complete